MKIDPADVRRPGYDCRRGQGAKSGHYADTKCEGQREFKAHRLTILSRDIRDIIVRCRHI